ncbi:PPC domain-containing DNA-binding protein [Fibrella sp. WM1]|uniref:PPC domain-containing DNA-binding protein n=1 Tax=Fibrella musci TaxID=3242485 RepID=UPI0035218C23
MSTPTLAQPKRYTKVPAGYLMVLQQGDNVFEQLETLARQESIPSATFTGLGFVTIQFGFFDFKKKEYKPKTFTDVELTSLTGSLAWQEGKPSIHAHGVVGDAQFKAHAGHILSATVSTGSVEIMITVHPQRLERKMDEKLGANVLSLDE